MPLKFLRSAFVAIAAVAALSPLVAQAFTLVAPVAKLYVNPKAGYTTSLVQVRGTATVNNTCTGAQLNFNFLFDSKALWSRSVSACTGSTWDTGWSAYLTPPVPRTVGKHTILLNLVNPANGAVVASASYVYSIYPAPASPRPATSPTQAAVTPSQAVASPSTSSCPAGSAMLPPAGTGSFGDGLVAGLVMFSVIPILGLALIGPGPLLAAVRRRSKLLMLLGLSALAALTLSCASTVAEQPTPAALVSPATSPSCSA